MKRILACIAAVAALALSCKPEATPGGNQPSKDTLPEIAFDEILYNIDMGGSAEIKIEATVAPAADLTIGVELSGDGYSAGQVSLSAESFTLKGGEKEAVLTVSDAGLAGGQTVKIALKEGGDYTLSKTKNATFLSVNEPEKIIYSFAQAKGELIESLTLTLNVSGEKSGAAYKAPADISLPFTVEGDAAEAVVASAQAFLVPKGGNKATVTLTLDAAKAENLAGDNAFIVIEGGDNVLAGDVARFKLKVHSGQQTPSKLVGTWAFDHVFDADEVMLWFEEMEDDPALLPLNNEGFRLVITEDEETGEVTLTPEGEGDFANFFREATLTLTAPMNLSSEEEVLGSYTTKGNNMFMAEEDDALVDFICTFYKLSSANRSFSADSESLGEAVVSFRLREDGGLELILRDYDTPPFGEMWWDPEGFDPEMFGFASLFTKVE